jgi:hypothetical protein
MLMTVYVGEGGWTTLVCTVQFFSLSSIPLILVPRCGIWCKMSSKQGFKKLDLFNVGYINLGYLDASEAISCVYCSGLYERQYY